jgi:hypothetical protein
VPTWTSKRLVIAIACTLLAVAGCNGASAAQKVATQSPEQPAPAAVTTPDPGQLVMWRVAAAAKAAAAEPHGEIGEAVVATAP